MPKVDRQAIYERDQGLCGFCGQSVPMELLHLDHYPVPRALGGLAVPENLRVAHRRCNIQAGKAVAAERRARGLPSAGGTIMFRGIDPVLWRRLRAASVIRSKTMGELLNDILSEWLARESPDPADARLKAAADRATPKEQQP